MRMMHSIVSIAAHDCSTVLYSKLCLFLCVDTLIDTYYHALTLFIGILFLFFNDPIFFMYEPRRGDSVVKPLIIPMKL